MERHRRAPVLEIMIGLTGIAMVIGVLAVQTRTDDETVLGMSQVPIQTLRTPVVEARAVPVGD